MNRVTGRLKCGSCHSKNSHPARTPEIARASGGDSLNVNDASAVETTFWAHPAALCHLFLPSRRYGKWTRNGTGSNRVGFPSSEDQRNPRFPAWIAPSQ